MPYFHQGKCLNFIQEKDTILWPKNKNYMTVQFHQTNGVRYHTHEHVHCSCTLVYTSAH